MKAKSKKQTTKRKHEFRFHDIEIAKKNGKSFKLKHPTYVFLEQGNEYIYVTITHASKIKENVVIKLRKNPNPIDGRDSYRVIGIKQDTKDQFGRRQEGWQMDEQDDQDIRDEYNKTIKIR